MNKRQVKRDYGYRQQKIIKNDYWTHNVIKSDIIIHSHFLEITGNVSETNKIPKPITNKPKHIHLVRRRKHKSCCTK